MSSLIYIYSHCKNGTYLERRQSILVQHSLLPTIHTKILYYIGMYVWREHSASCTLCLHFILLYIYFQPMLHTLFMNFVTVHIDLTRSYFQKEVFYLGVLKFFFFESFILFLAPRRCIVRSLVQLCKNYQQFLVTPLRFFFIDIVYQSVYTKILLVK